MVSLFKKKLQLENLKQPDLTVSVYLCALHKDFCSINKKIVPTAIIPNNVITSTEVREVVLLEKYGGGKAKVPVEKRVSQVITASGKHLEVKTQVSGDASKVADNFVVSPDLVIQNLRFIEQCKDCKVEIDVVRA
jgi:hypothetical protein